MTGKQFVESHSQAVHVGLGNRLLLLDRLGCDVGPRPLDDLAFLLDLACQREIDQPGFTGFGHQQVVGLDVPVDPTLRMNISERLADLFEHLLYPALRSQRVGVHGRAEVLRTEVVHREVGDGVLDRHESLDLELHLVDADKIRVVQYLAQFEFLLELGEDRLVVRMGRVGDDFVTEQFQRKGLPAPFLDHFEHIADLAGRNVGDHGELVDLEYVVGHWVALPSESEKRP